jgi:hypothetical protein
LPPIKAGALRYDERTNYCFVEWGWATNRFRDDEDRILYVSGEATRDWENLAPDAPLALWYKHVRKKKVRPTPQPQRPNATEVLETIKSLEELRDYAILGAWTRLELAAP